MKYYKKTLGGILTASLLFSIPFSAIAQDDISKIEEKKEESKKHINNLEKDLDKIKNNLFALENTLKELQITLNKTSSKITETEQRIQTLQKKIEKTKKEIEIAEIDLNKKKATLSKTLRVMYMKGEHSSIEYLFSSENFSDLISRSEDNTKLAKANNDLYEKVREQLRNLNDKKATLTKQKQEVTLEKDALIVLKNEQEKNKEQQRKVMVLLKEKRKHTEVEIQKEQSAISEMNNQIASIIREREAKKRAAAEAAAREKEKQNQNQNQNQNPDKNTNPPYVPEGELQGTGQFSIPVPAGSYTISSGFGYRSDPFSGQNVLHSGTDFAANYGTPILAADSGTVLFARPASGYGHWVVIDHNNGYWTIYGHMYGNQIMVQEGQSVKRGQQIAAVGSDGGSTGNHLHFCVANGFNGSTFSYLDPMSFFR